eukprot:3700800-Rhodomonas_salina.1
MDSGCRSSINACSPDTSAPRHHLDCHARNARSRGVATTRLCVARVLQSLRGCAARLGCSLL